MGYRPRSYRKILTGAATAALVASAIATGPETPKAIYREPEAQDDGTKVKKRSKRKRKR